MLLAALLIVAIAGPSAPTPQPTHRPLRTIVTVKTTAFCSVVHNLAFPIGFVTRRNADAFVALEQPIINVIAQNRGVASATADDISNALANGNDDTLTYNAGNTISMETISKITWQIYQNLAMEDKIMNASWKTYPQGMDPRIDKLRQRLQNLMDLQGALADQYSKLSDMYLDNTGGASYQADTIPSQGDSTDNTSANQGSFKATLRDMIYGQVTALIEAQKAANDPTAIQPKAQDKVGELARLGSTKDIARELTLQEIAFGHEITTSGQDCGY